MRKLVYIDDILFEAEPRIKCVEYLTLWNLYTNDEVPTEHPYKRFPILVFNTKTGDYTVAKQTVEVRFEDD